MASHRLRKLLGLWMGAGAVWNAPILAKEAEPVPAVTAPAPLTLEVVDRGPDLPWSFRLTNVSEEHVGLFGDPRLLWFDVVVPGQARSQSCRLPAEMLPKEGRMRSWRILAPGETYVRHLDPRFYCFGSGSESVLVPGAVVTPHFGWPDKTRTVWRHGKRIEEKLAAVAPFVAFHVAPPADDVPEPAPAPPSPPPKASDKPAAGAHTPAPAPEGSASTEDVAEDPAESWEGAAPDTSEPVQKNANATAFALNSEYRVWSEDGLDADTPEEPALGIAVTHGSDAANERDATITIALKNRSARGQTVYFRRELARLSVLKPGGLVECPESDEPRAPSELSFIPLGAGQTMSLSARLVEMCPRGTFARPGLYLVNIEFDAEYSGREIGLEAFTGRLRGKRAVPVRIRNGELPFLSIRQGTRGGGGGPAPASAPIPVSVPPPAPPPPPAQ